MVFWSILGNVACSRSKGFGEGAPPRFDGAPRSGLAGAAAPRRARILKAAATAAAAADIAERLAHAAEQSARRGRFDAFVTAMSAVGFSVAAAGGTLDLDTRRDVIKFVSRVFRSDLPEHTQELIAELSQTPPSISRAMHYLDDVDPAWREGELAVLVDDVVEAVCASDKRTRDRASDWRSSWHEAIRRAPAREACRAG